MKKLSFQALRGLSAALVIILMTSALYGQDAESLTSFRYDTYRGKYIQELEVFNGQIYTANQASYPGSEGRVSRLDPESGTLTPLQDPEEFLGGQGNDRFAGTFQQLDDKLFAQLRDNASGMELYRIADQQVIRLTDLVNRPLTDLVLLGDQYYFLVSGKPSGAVKAGGQRSSYLDLWQTDGTRQGTRLVEELPFVHTSNTGNNTPTLTAGEGSLLVSGYQADQTDASFLTYFLYRPGTGIVPLSLSDGSPYRAPAVRATSSGCPRIAFFAGGFYLAGTGLADQTGDTEVFRIDEATGLMRDLPGLLAGPYQRSLGEEVSYAVVGDSLYLHVAVTSQGYRFLAAGAETPEAFRQVAWANWHTAEAGLAVRGDTLYFGGGNQYIEQAIMRYIPATGEVKALFGESADALEANLYVAEDVVYAVSRYSKYQIRRYRPSLDQLDLFDNFAPYRSGWESFGADLSGNDLVYTGFTQVGVLPTAEQNPYLLARDAGEPRKLFDPEVSIPIGVTAMMGETADGDILFAGYDEDVSFQHYRYDPESDSVSMVAFEEPSLGATSPTYLNSIDGQEIFTVYDYQKQGYVIYALRGDSLKEVTDATTGTALVVDLYYLLRYDFLTAHKDGATELYRYQFEGDTATRVLLNSLNSYHYRSGTTNDGLVVLHGTYGNNNMVTLTTREGEVVYDFLYTSDQEVAYLDSTGYYLVNFPVGGEVSLEYHPATGGEVVRMAYPPGVTPFPGRSALSLDGRLVFLPYHSATGQEFYVADPESGSIELLRDIHPGPGSSNPGALTQTGGTLYFSANDGVHGTELWRTDGTANGTYLVSDLNPGLAPGRPMNFHVGDSILYFSATAAAGAEVYGMKLGTEEVRMLADINSGIGDSHPRSFLAASSGLYGLARADSYAPLQLYRIEPAEIPVSVSGVDQAAAGFNLFPNPASGDVTLQSESGEEIVRVQLYDGSGRLLRDARERGSQVRLSVRDLRPGRYVTVVHYASGAGSAASLVVLR